jgi:hypothetical protein
MSHDATLRRIGRVASAPISKLLVAPLICFGRAQLGARTERAGPPRAERFIFPRITRHATFISPKQGLLSIAPQSHRKRAATAARGAGSLRLLVRGDQCGNRVDDGVGRDGRARPFRTRVTRRSTTGCPCSRECLRVHQNNGALVAANGNFYPIPAGLSTAPTLSLDTARSVALHARSRSIAGGRRSTARHRRSSW